jgi:branched-subunit amino acid transport protein AzlD
MTNVMHKFFSMYLFLFITLYMFRACRAHHQERQIVSIQPLVTVILCWWPRCVQVGRRPAHILTNIERLLPEAVLIQFVSPDDEHDMLETCREL